MNPWLVVVALVVMALLTFAYALAAAADHGDQILGEISHRIRNHPGAPLAGAVLIVGCLCMASAVAGGDPGAPVDTLPPAEYVVLPPVTP